MTSEFHAKRGITIVIMDLRQEGMTDAPIQGPGRPATVQQWSRLIVLFGRPNHTRETQSQHPGQGWKPGSSFGPAHHQCQRLAVEVHLEELLAKPFGHTLDVSDFTPGAHRIPQLMEFAANLPRDVSHFLSSAQTLRMRADAHLTFASVTIISFAHPFFESCSWGFKPREAPHTKFQDIAHLKEHYPQNAEGENQGEQDQERADSHAVLYTSSTTAGP